MSAVEGDNPPLAAIFGLAGEHLNGDERRFFSEANPLGFILFARNCQNPDQVKALTASLQDLMGRAVPVLIDQEGGRVQRLKPPHWPAYPSARHFGDAYAADKSPNALQKSFTALTADLRALGINVNCAPVLDVAYDTTDNSIGDRAFSRDPEAVAALGAETCRVSLAGGVIPVIKHLPGLGRAALDTHKDLPAIEADLPSLEASDFLPFRRIAGGTAAPGIWGMAGHAIYRAIDPDTPASCADRVIGGIIRGNIGFDGLLLTDDLDMGALSFIGTADRRAEAALQAGCDIALQCNGDLKTMEAVAARIPVMTSQTVMRYNRSVSWLWQNLQA